MQVIASCCVSIAPAYSLLLVGRLSGLHFIGDNLFSSPRTGWNLLQDLIQARTKKLAGAYEIHKFNRDAKEILARIKVRVAGPAESSLQ
jgi:hypothetical protein